MTELMVSALQEVVDTSTMRTSLRLLVTASLGITLSLMTDASAIAQPITAADYVTGRLVGGLTDYVVQRGDSLTQIAARFGLDIATLAKQNGLAPKAVIAAGRELRIDNRHIVPDASAAPIVINVPQRMLFWRGDDGTIRAYPVAAGRPTWRTPIGPFSIAIKTVNPTWHVPPSIQAEIRRAGRVPPTAVPPGPANPLGDRWMATTLGNIGIHGTNAPLSIYTLTTHGCIRVHPDDIRQLFDLVTVGTMGATVYQPTLIARSGDRIFVEAHRDLYKREQDPLTILREVALRDGLTESVDWLAAEQALHDRAGFAIDVTLSVPSGSR